MNLEKKAVILSLVLILCLLCAVALGISSTPGDPSDAQTSPNLSYNITISEICAKNETIIADNQGKYRDYIELYNAGSPMDLAGFCLTDGKIHSAPLGHMRLGTGEYGVIFLDKATTGFALGASGGDTIQLLDPQGNIAAQATTAVLTEDQVMLWNNGNYTVSMDASPGFSNDAQGLFAFHVGRVQDSPKLLINEVLIGNVSALPDEQGIYSDVIELYNASNDDVMLDSFYLSDSYEQRFRYRMPALTVPAGSYLVLYCDGENYIGENGEIHTNFALSHGETLYLTDRNGEYVTVAAEYLADDLSLSRTTDGSYTSAAVSLGYANDEIGISQFTRSRIDDSAALVINEVLLSSAEIPYAGSFCDVVEILNRSEETVSTKGWYLSDGGDPYKYPLPEMELAPGQCTLIVCGTQTTGFSLSDGETLRLTAPTYRYAPPVTCGDPAPGQSISRLENGSDISYCFGAVTLGYANTADNHVLFLQDHQPKALMISEMMSINHSYLKGPYATTCDWIELYNASDADIRLSDYHISDNAGNLQRYALPDKVLKPGEYCVIFLSETTTNLLSGYSVLPFPLSSGGEQLYLSKDGMIEDYVFLPALELDTAYGRPSGSALFSLLENVTPGKQNGGPAQISADPVASIPQGVYNDVEYVDIAFSGEGKIYYTTDCTAPNRNAKLYTGPIRITKTTVFRVIHMEDGKKPSAIVDFTYLINENDTLDAVCIVTEPDNLWSEESGIYVTGPNASDTEPYYGANYWKDWEKEATISLFEDGGIGFSSGCGIKIFGGYSRAEEKKSLACFFRSEYGSSELDYPLFGEAGPDTYESFVLRSGGQDVFWARMRDVMITSLVAEQTGVAVQKYRPVVVYLNGQYFGLHYIREKLNTHYVAGNFNVTADTVILCETEGRNSASYQALIKYAMNHDLSQREHYDYVCSQIDVDNYIDYMVAQIWIGNQDNSNVRFFKTDEHKWTWILYDTDLSFYQPSFNSVANHLNANYIGSNDWTSKTLAVRLLKNAEFKDKFLRRLAWQINNIWTEENVSARISQIEALIAQDMVKDCQRWNKSYSVWQNNLESLREFTRVRNGYLMPYIQRYFNLTDAQMLEYGFPV